jgi:hypothetical protein
MTSKIKKILIVPIILLFILSSCSDAKNIDGIIYEPYGLFNKDEIADPKIHYALVMGNVIWGIFLWETIIGPIYFFGFDLYEPISLKYQGETS